MTDRETTRRLRSDGRRRRAAVKAQAKAGAPGRDVQFATVKEAARFLNLSRPSIYKLLNTGALDSKMFLTARRIPWAALRRLAGMEP
jgi:excisionase family DNA binding protein